MTMSENQKKWWKLVLIAVPVIISNIGSYAKARAESKDESQASYEALSAALAELKKDSDEDHDHLASLEDRVAVLTDQLEKANAHVERAHPGMRPLVPMTADAGVDGIPDKPKPFFRRRRLDPLNATLPTRFDDVVQQYKAKK